MNYELSFGIYYGKISFLGKIPMNAEELHYEERIRQLEENIANLRMSRRILMNLLEQVQYSRKEELERLEKEKRRLRKISSNYAGQLWEKNRRIRELEDSAVVMSKK